MTSSCSKRTFDLNACIFLRLAAFCKHNGYSALSFQIFQKEKKKIIGEKEKKNGNHRLHVSSYRVGINDDIAYFILFFNFISN